MFSSNPFPQLPSSPHGFPPPSSFFDPEKDGVYLKYHQINDDPFISDDCFFLDYNRIAPPPAVMEDITIINEDFVRQQQQLSKGSGLQHCEDHDDLSVSVISPSKKKMATLKKHGHRKIHTAQGPRDRRVRLSVEIARKFFCLQDLLGFDKASKTLGWLFTNSKTAIKEVVEEKMPRPFSTVSGESEVNFLETIKGGSDEDKGEKMKSVLYVGGKRKKMTRKSKAEFEGNLAKDQSRAEARARARERTRDKTRIKKLDNELKTLVPDDFDCQVSPSNITLQSSCWSQIESQSDY